MSISSSTSVYDYWHCTITDMRSCIFLLIQCRFGHKIFREDRDVARHLINHGLINILVITRTTLSSDNGKKKVFKLGMHMMMTRGDGLHYLEITYNILYAWSFVLMQSQFNPWSRYFVAPFYWKPFTYLFLSKIAFTFKTTYLLLINVKPWACWYTPLNNY